MGHLDFNKLKNDLNEKFGPFVIDYGEESDPKSVEFDYILMTTPDKRKALYKFFETFLKVQSGKMTDEELEELAGEDGDGLTILGESMRDAMKALATNKTKFNAFARAVGSADFVIWGSIMDSYFEHYNLLESVGEQRPSDNS